MIQDKSPWSGLTFINPKEQNQAQKQPISTSQACRPPSEKLSSHSFPYRLPFMTAFRDEPRWCDLSPILFPGTVDITRSSGQWWKRRPRCQGCIEEGGSHFLSTTSRCTNKTPKYPAFPGQNHRNFLILCSGCTIATMKLSLPKSSLDWDELNTFVPRNNRPRYG